MSSPSACLPQTGSCEHPLICWDCVVVQLACLPIVTAGYKGVYVRTLVLLLLQTRDPSKPPDVLLLRLYDEHVGYCQFDGQVKLKKRKRQEGDEPRPEKVRTVH